MSKLNNGELKTCVYFVDVGQGDCELIVDGNFTVLIDCGEVEKGSYVVKHLKKCGISHIDYFIGTHPHTDHIGGFVEVANNFEIKNVIIPEIPKKLIPVNPTYTKFMQTLLNKKINVQKAEPGLAYKLNRGEIKILGPCKNDYNNLNDFSVITKFICGQHSFLFCGDAQKAAETDLIKSNQQLKSNVFKLSHHGSLTSNSNQFLKCVGATIYVAEVGKNNSYNHPNKKVLKRLKNSKLFRTDQNGTILFETDGELLEVKTEK